MALNICMYQLLLSVILYLQGFKLAEDSFNPVPGSTCTNQYLPDSFRINLPSSLTASWANVLIFFTLKRKDPGI